MMCRTADLALSSMCCFINSVVAIGEKTNYSWHVKSIRMQLPLPSSTVLPLYEN